MQEKLNVFVLEVREGDEKIRDEHGFRKDTMPIINSLREKGVQADVVFFSETNSDELFEKLKIANVVINRVNPGNIPGGEAGYFTFLNKLVASGVIVLADPATMMSYGAKDAVAKLAGTKIVPANTFSYYDLVSLKEKFPASLATGSRVLKQNRGSQGSGIWLVKVDSEHTGEVNDQTPIICTEAVDNHVENRTLGEFMEFCNTYLVGENGMLVDMPFLPRIAEGEIRILMVGQSPIFVVHKKPQEGGFSATLGSGAQYTYQKPEEWPELMAAFKESMEIVRAKLGGSGTPLIWTADFILDTDETGNDTYVLGEINCSCVGFTSQLDYGIQDMIAIEVIERVTAHQKSNAQVQV